MFVILDWLTVNAVLNGPEFEYATAFIVEMIYLFKCFRENLNDVAN